MTENVCALPAPMANRTAEPHHSSDSSSLQGAFEILNPRIRQAVAAEGYQSPTPIQEQCIPPLLEGRDLIGSAQTGTGKTAAFTLPLLHRLAQSQSREQGKRRPGTPKVLILAPTRELAAQIGDSIQAYGQFLRFRHTVIFGGVSQHRQVRALSQGVDILVATPGRLLDLMNQGYIHLDNIGIFILDEVDRMLDMGFIHDIKRVLAKLPEKRQTVFLSATMPQNMEDLARTMVKDPVRVTITPEAPAVERISQKMYFVGKSNKEALLHSILDDTSIRKAIVFTQMKHAANRVVAKLEKAGIASAALHGNKSQAARTKALQGFKDGRFRVLVATDVAARGLDVDDITHVINYDLPNDAETYVHRIGRTARAGTDGDAFSFCTAEDRGLLRDIERLLGKQVPVQTEHQFHCNEALHSSHSGSSGSPGRRNRQQGGNRGNRSNRSFRPKRRGNRSGGDRRQRTHSRG